MLSDNLNWGDFRYFLEVARRTRLLSAGKALGVNHSTVSRRINALETSLQVQLFEQDETGFHLTPLGESILPIAQQIEDAIELTKEKAQSSPQVLSGNLRIGAPDGFGNSFLAERITEFTSIHPEMIIELVAVPLNHNLLKREVDLAITLEPLDRKDILCQRVTDYSLYLYTTQKYIEENDIDIEDLESIKQHPFSGYIRDILYSTQLDFNSDIAKGLNEKFRGSTVMSQYHFIACGGGLGVFPHYMVHDDPRFVRVLPDKISFKRTYWLLIPIDLARLAGVRAVERYIMGTAKANAKLLMPDS